jgi:hypothetical protein
VCVNVRTTHPAVVAAAVRLCTILVVDQCHASHLKLIALHFEIDVEAMEHLLLPHGAVISDDEKASYIADVYDGGPFLTRSAAASKHSTRSLSRKDSIDLPRATLMSRRPEILKCFSRLGLSLDCCVRSSEAMGVLCIS